MSEDENDINAYEPSLLRPRQLKRNISLTQNSFSRCALSLKRRKKDTGFHSNIDTNNKENVHPCGQNISRNKKTNFQQNLGLHKYANKKNLEKKNTDCSFGADRKCFVDKNESHSKQILVYQDKDSEKSATGFISEEICTDISLFSFDVQSDKGSFANKYKENADQDVPFPQTFGRQICDKIIKTRSSDSSSCCKSGNLIEHKNINSRRNEISLVLSVKSCKNLEINTKNCDIKSIQINHNIDEFIIYSKIHENVELWSCKSTNTQESDSGNEDLDATRLTMFVNVEVKKENSQAAIEKQQKSQVNKVLSLNTNAVRNISNVVVQPPNYKLVKRQISHKNKLKRRRISVSGISKRNDGENECSIKWKQKSILDYLNKQSDLVRISNESDTTVLLENFIHKSLSFKNAKSILSRDTSVEAYGQEMSKNLSLIESNQSELKSGKSKSRNNEQLSKSRSPTFRSEKSSKKQNSKVPSTIVSRNQPVKTNFDTISNYSSTSPMRSIGSPAPDPIKNKIKKTKTSVSIPYYKIIAGTHFAVDAFCYGKIPHVENYFLTHFHSDHYLGLNKSFSKTVFCSKITAELCMTRLGVTAECIRIINPDETIFLDGVEITAVDANHCPGAIMLVFTLLSGKTTLHTGDFRATSSMESYPIFWNKDIHTVYLDTTYCNPRYDFPTQDQSLEMALYLLRQKKQEVEKAGHSFSSVLIICGTYTIGKEKFLLGIARRVGCSVWACSEKATVLSAVEGHVFNMSPPETCQLHALPMRDLTYEKLKSYLESFKGKFNEVVAFKPSGWENGKKSTIERDKVSIHGIPYSEHSSFSELVRFIKYLKPKVVVPTVDISGGVKTVQKYFPCPLVYKEDDARQSRVTDYFTIQKQQVPAVT